MKKEDFEKECREIFSDKLLDASGYIDDKYFSEGKGKQITQYNDELNTIITKHTVNENLLVLANHLALAWSQLHGRR